MGKKKAAGKLAEKQVRISSALHHKLSVYAANERTSNSAVAEAAIAGYLQAKKVRAQGA